MSKAKIIDGKVFAQGLRERIAKEIKTLKAEHGLTPGLAVVLVGDDPASQIYVRSKGKLSKEVGMNSWEYLLPDTASETEVLKRVRALNADPDIHGILVQLPLPDQINPNNITYALDPNKDVDGLHPINAGRLVAGEPGPVPCTPVGCMMLIRDVLDDLKGKRALVIGRSLLVGKPVAQLLLAEHCTVTMAHSRTQDLAGECRNADIIVAAVGQPRLVKGDWIKPGAVVIDVGTNRIPAPEKGEGKTRLVGDVAFDEALNVAGAITPVPGGVGPMTIACLLANTVSAACLQKGIEPPRL